MRRLRYAERTSTATPKTTKLAKKAASRTRSHFVGRESAGVWFTLESLARVGSLHPASGKREEDRSGRRVAGRLLRGVAECVRGSNSCRPLFLEQVQRPALDLFVDAADVLAH